MQSEPLHVSARFHCAITAAAIELERQAANDEQMLEVLVDPDHRRRHSELVDAQLTKAFRLREMVKQMRVRDEICPPSLQARLPR
jgi:hypothetical protein